MLTIGKTNRTHIKWIRLHSTFSFLFCLWWWIMDVVISLRVTGLFCYKKKTILFFVVFSVYKSLKKNISKLGCWFCEWWDVVFMIFIWKDSVELKNWNFCWYDSWFLKCFFSLPILFSFFYFFYFFFFNSGIIKSHCPITETPFWNKMLVACIRIARVKNLQTFFHWNKNYFYNLAFLNIPLLYLHYRGLTDTSWENYLHSTSWISTEWSIKLFTV